MNMFVMSAVIDTCVTFVFSIICITLTSLNVLNCSSEAPLVSVFPILLITHSIILSISSLNTTAHVVEDYNYHKFIVLSVGFGCLLCHIAFIVVSAVALSLSETCLNPDAGPLFGLIVVSFAFLIWSGVKLMTSISVKLRF